MQISFEFLFKDTIKECLMDMFTLYQHVSFMNISHLKVCNCYKVYTIRSIDSKHTKLL